MALIGLNCHDWLWCLFSVWSKCKSAPVELPRKYCGEIENSPLEKATPVNGIPDCSWDSDCNHVQGIKSTDFHEITVLVWLYIRKRGLKRGISGGLVQWFEGLKTFINNKVAGQIGTCRDAGTVLQFGINNVECFYDTRLQLFPLPLMSHTDINVIVKQLEFS